MIEEIREQLVKISNNLNGNHERSIRELENAKEDITEVIDNLKEKRDNQIRNTALKSCGIILLVFGLLFIVNAGISYNINGISKLSVGENQTTIMQDVNIDGNLTAYNLEISDFLCTDVAVVDHSGYSRFAISTSPPDLSDCLNQSDYGRNIIKYDGTPPSKNVLYVCTDDGWVKTDLI